MPIAEYAALAAHANRQQHDIPHATAQDLPSGWQDLAELGFSAGHHINRLNAFHFTAGVYLNEASNEIVIAYANRDAGPFEEPARHMAADRWASPGPTFSTRLALVVGRQLKASAYYLAVTDWLADNGYDPGRIRFTGHRLGGGLAANMAVWYDHPATTFAATPFEASTANPVAIGTAIAAASAQWTVSTSVAAQEAIHRLRQLQMSDILLQGEMDRRDAAVTKLGIGADALTQAPESRALRIPWRGTENASDGESHGERPGQYIGGDTGLDIHVLDGSAGSDIVVDEAQGVIRHLDQVLTGGSETAPGSGQWQEGAVRYHLFNDGDRQHLLVDAGASSVLVQGWRNGQLGIRLAGQLRDARR